MKHIIILSIILLCGCKEKSKNDVVTPAVKREITDSDIENLYQYYHANPSTQEQKDENKLIDYATEHELYAERTHNGVFIVLNEKGSGTKIKYGDPLAAHYTGKFLDGKIFDSSKKPIEFRVGQMIAGWTEALLTRNRGDKFTLLIPSHLAYGKRGFEGFVPPDANLIFDIEILDEK